MASSTISETSRVILDGLLLPGLLTIVPSLLPLYKAGNATFTSSYSLALGKNTLNAAGSPTARVVVQDPSLSVFAEHHFPAKLYA